MAAPTKEYAGYEINGQFVPVERPLASHSTASAFLHHPLPRPADSPVPPRMSLSERDEALDAFRARDRARASAYTHRCLLPLASPEPGPSKPALPEPASPETPEPAPFELSQQGVSSTEPAPSTVTMAQIDFDLPSPVDNELRQAIPSQAPSVVTEERAFSEVSVAVDGLQLFQSGNDDETSLERDDPPGHDMKGANNDRDSVVDFWTRTFSSEEPDGSDGSVTVGRENDVEHGQTQSSTAEQTNSAGYAGQHTNEPSSEATDSTEELEVARSSAPIVDESAEVESGATIEQATEGTTPTGANHTAQLTTEEIKRVREVAIYSMIMRSGLGEGSNTNKTTANGNTESGNTKVHGEECPYLEFASIKNAITRARGNYTIHEEDKKKPEEKLQEIRRRAKNLKEKRKRLAKQKLSTNDQRLVDHTEAENRLVVDRAAIEVQIQELENKMKEEERNEEDFEWYKRQAFEWRRDVEFRYMTKVIIHLQEDDNLCEKMKEASKRGGIKALKDRVRELVGEFEISGRAIDQASDKEFKNKVKDMANIGA